jgi:hypothetical protein
MFQFCQRCDASGNLSPAGIAMLFTVLFADLPRLLDDISGMMEDTQWIRLVRNPSAEGKVAAAWLAVPTPCDPVHDPAG